VESDNGVGAAAKDEDVDMDIEERETLPPPPPPPRGDDMVGPARPPAGMDPAQAYAYPSADAYPSEEEYVQANVAYQVCLLMYCRRSALFCRCRQLFHSQGVALQCCFTHCAV
jgi:hypothetical protein